MKITVNAPSWWRGADKTRSYEWNPTTPEGLMNSDTGPVFGEGQDPESQLQRAVRDYAAVGYTGRQPDGTVTVDQNPWGIGDAHYLTPENERFINQNFSANAMGVGSLPGDTLFGKIGSTVANAVPGAINAGVMTGLGAAFGNAGGGLSGITSGLGNGFAGVDYFTPGGAELSGGSGATTLSGGTSGDVLTANGNSANGIRIGATATGIGGDALGTGLTAGTASPGIGGGALGSGIGASTSLAGALAPGYFASESLYPVAGGLASAAANGSSSGGAAAGGSAISRILNGGATAADYASILGTVGAAGLSAYGSSQQANSLSGLAQQYSGYGAPSRGRYEASFAPGFTMENDPGYTDALNQTTKATLARMSVNGNPAGSPNAWSQTLKDVNAGFAYPALQSYRNTNATAGGLQSGAAAAPQLGAQAINAQGQALAPFGGALADIFAPPKTTSLADLIRGLR